MLNLYDSNYYSHQKDGSYASAEVIVPLVLQFYRPKSVVDVGCGVGNWLSVFLKNGVEKILGLDGDYVDRSQLRIAEQFFKPVNLEQPIPDIGTFDMAMSLEVAEHLPQEVAEQFVKNITSLAPVILFSAAVPYQGGTHHVNEQWPEYWQKLFALQGFVPVDPLRRLVWDNSSVDWWYAQNIMFYVKESELEKYPQLNEARKATAVNQLSLVHPRMISLRLLKNAGLPLALKKLKSIFFK